MHIIHEQQLSQNVINISIKSVEDYKKKKTRVFHRLHFLHQEILKKEKESVFIVLFYQY